jgi:hypothetical protein
MPCVALQPPLVLLLAVVQEAIRTVTEAITTNPKINLFILWNLVRYGIKRSLNLKFQ